MITFNMFLSFSGLAGWLWVWWHGRYKTGCDIRIQVGVMLMGLVWLLLVLADAVQHLQPTSGTIVARLFMIIGMWCLMPLLKYKPQNPILEEQEEQKGTEL